MYKSAYPTYQCGHCGEHPKRAVLHREHDKEPRGILYGVPQAPGMMPQCSSLKTKRSHRRGIRHQQASEDPRSQHLLTTSSNQLHVVTSRVKTRRLSVEDAEENRQVCHVPAPATLQSPAAMRRRRSSSISSFARTYVAVLASSVQFFNADRRL